MLCTTILCADLVAVCHAKARDACAHVHDICCGTIYYGILMHGRNYTITQTTIAVPAMP